MRGMQIKSVTKEKQERPQEKRGVQVVQPFLLRRFDYGLELQTTGSLVSLLRLRPPLVLALVLVAVSDLVVLVLVAIRLVFLLLLASHPARKRKGWREWKEGGGGKKGVERREGEIEDSD